MIKLINEQGELKDVKIKDFDLNDYIKFLKKELGNDYNLISDFILNKAKKLVKNNEGVSAFNISGKIWEDPIDKIYFIFEKNCTPEMLDDIFTYSAHALGCMLYSVILADTETWFVTKTHITKREFAVLRYFK
jgi:hypothetical protein